MSAESRCSEPASKEWWSYMSESEKRQSVVVSLQEHRRQRNQIARREAMPLEDRIRDLELSLAKATDLLLILNESVDQLEDRSWKVLRLLRKMAGEENLGSSKEKP